MIKTKIKRIEELNDKYLILNEKEMKFLRKCLKSRKQDVRWTAAEILVGWYTPENERLLYNLTYDKAELVCVDATDSLCIGRTRRSLSRLRDLMEDKRSRVRGYAVLSFFSGVGELFFVERKEHESISAFCRNHGGGRKQDLGKTFL